MNPNQPQAGTDTRQWVRVSVDLYTNMKFMSLSDPTAAIGAYVVALCVSAQSFSDGAFPIAMVQRVTGISDTLVKEMITEELWHDRHNSCERCPTPRDGHGYIHDYLLHQRSAQQVKKLKEDKSAAGSLGAAKRWGKTRLKQEKQRETEKQQAIAAGQPVDSVARPDVEMLCNGFANLIARNDSKGRRPAIGKAWYTDMRLMIDRDGFTVDELKEVIEWTQGDPFWSKNVKSPFKLREQLKATTNDLMGKMRASKAGAGQAGRPSGRVQGTLVFEGQDEEFDRQAQTANKKGNP